MSRKIPSRFVWLCYGAATTFVATTGELFIWGVGTVGRWIAMLLYITLLIASLLLDAEKHVFDDDHEPHEFTEAERAQYRTEARAIAEAVAPFIAAQVLEQERQRLIAESSALLAALTEPDPQREYQE